MHERDEEADGYEWMDRIAEVCLLLVAVGIVGVLITEGVRAWV